MTASELRAKKAEKSRVGMGNKISKA